MEKKIGIINTNTEGIEAIEDIFHDPRNQIREGAKPEDCSFRILPGESFLMDVPSLKRLIDS